MKSTHETIQLDEPIQRGTTKITELTLRRPKAGELRGLSMLSVMQMQTEALFTLLPRICDPVLTPAEMNNLDPADLVAIGSTVAGFSVPKSMQMDMETPVEVSGKTIHS